MIDILFFAVLFLWGYIIGLGVRKCVDRLKRKPPAVTVQRGRAVRDRKKGFYRG